MNQGVELGGEVPLVVEEAVAEGGLGVGVEVVELLLVKDCLSEGEALPRPNPRPPHFLPSEGFPSRGP